MCVLGRCGVCFGVCTDVCVEVKVIVRYSSLCFPLFGFETRILTESTVHGLSWTGWTTRLRDLPDSFIYSNLLVLVRVIIAVIGKP